MKETMSIQEALTILQQKYPGRAWSVKREEFIGARPSMWFAIWEGSSIVRYWFDGETTFEAEIARIAGKPHFTGFDDVEAILEVQP